MCEKKNTTFCLVAAKIDRFQAPAHTMLISLCHSHHNLLKKWEKRKIAFTLRLNRTISLSNNFLSNFRLVHYGNVIQFELPMLLPERFPKMLPLNGGFRYPASVICVTVSKMQTVNNTTIDVTGRVANIIISVVALWAELTDFRTWNGTLSIADWSRVFL